MFSTALRPFPAVLILLLCVSMGAAGQAGGAEQEGGAWPARSGHVQAAMLSAGTSIQQGTQVTVGILLRMDPGWHVYWWNPGQAGLPTTVDWHLPAGWTATPLRWPVPERFQAAGLVTWGYSNEVLLTAELVPPPGLAAGTSVVLGARVSWLVCRVECIPGDAVLSLTLPVRQGKPTAEGRWAAALAGEGILGDRGRAGAAGVVLALLLALAGGFILNLMPCVLPVLSLKVLSLVRNSQEDRGGVSTQSAGYRGGSFRHGLYFAAGVIASFLAIGGVLIGLRSVGRLIGWGFQFQDPVVVAITAMLFFLIGLNLFGVFEVGSARLSPGAGSSGRAPALRSFLSGLFAAAVATPCTAPFMGAALGYGLSRAGPVALAVFAALGVGMSAPYVILTAFPRIGARLPGPGRWMETLRQLMGFPMMAAVVWMLFVFSALSGSASLVALAGALLAAGLGAWIWGRWGGASARRPARLAAGSAAILLVAGAVAFAVVIATGPTTSADGAVGAQAAHAWESWSPGRVEELRGQGRAVFIDFTARWCLSCQVNEAVALKNPGVLRRFQDLGVATLRADWTDRNDQIATAIASYGRAGVPLYVLYGSGAEPILLPELLTPGVVLRALDALP